MVSLVFSLVIPLIEVEFPMVTADSNDWEITSDNDNAMETGDGATHLSYTMVKSYNPASDFNHRDSGLLFNNINIPQGAVIDVAYMELNVRSIGDDVDCTIYGHDIDDSPNFVDDPDIKDTRARSGNSTAFTRTGMGEGWETTPSVVDVVQEIVDRPGWSSGNNMTFLWIASVNGYVFYTYDFSDGEPAKLHIEWTTTSTSPTVESHTSDDPQLDGTYNWFNVTVSDPQGWVDIDYIDVQLNTTGDAETVTLRWTRTTNIFSEEVDASNICTLDTNTSVAFHPDINNTLACFYYQFDDGTYGDVDAKPTAVDSGAEEGTVTYNEDFFYGEESTSSIVDTIDPSIDAVHLTNYVMQTMSFYSNSRYWVFYTNETNLLYISSTDGDTWTNKTSIYGNEGNLTSNGKMSFFYNQDDDLLHVVYAEVQAGYNVTYRAGYPQTNGSITWLSAWHNVTTFGSLFGEPTIVCDSEGYPFVTLSHHTDSLYGRVYVFKSSTKNGTWTTDWYFSDINYGNFSDQYHYNGILTPQPNEEMVFVFGTGNQQFHYRTYDGSIPVGTGGGALNSTGWSAVIEDFTTHSVNATWLTYDTSTRTYPTVADEFGFLYQDNSSFTHYFMEWNGTGFDPEETVVSTGNVTTADLTYSAGNYFVFYYDLYDYGIYYRARNDDDTWNASILLTSELQHGTNAGFYWGGMTTCYEAFGEKIFGNYYRNASSYDLMFFPFSGVVVPVIVNASITDMEGCGAWVFVDEQYYHFQLTSFHPDGAENIDTVMLRISDGHTTMDVKFDTMIDEWSITEGSDKILLQNGVNVTSGDYLTANFPIYFRALVLDTLNVDIYAFVNDTDGYETGWVLTAENYFSIYNFGGFPSLTHSEKAGRIEDEGLFDLWAFTNETGYYWVLSNVTYRNLQHYQGLLHIHIPTIIMEGIITTEEHPIGSILFGIDYCYGVLDVEWVSGWYANLSITDYNIGAKNFTIEYDVSWYYANSFVKTDTLYAFWEGKTATSSDRDGFSIQLDLWFDSANASSMVGGRVGSEYYAISDTSPWYAFWTETWGPLLNSKTQSEYFGNLTTADSQHSSRNVKMMRVWAMINASSLENNEYAFNLTIDEFELNEFLTSPGNMMGIDPPPLVPTKVPNMPQSGFLAPVINGLRDFADRISYAINYGFMGTLPIVIGFLDTLFSAAGWKNGFSIILSWISSFLSIVVTGLNYVITLLGSIFTIFASWMLWGLSQFSLIAIGLGTIFTTLTSIYETSLAGWVDISEFITPLLPLLPVGFFFWLLNSRDLEHMIRKMALVWGLLQSMTGFLIRIGQYTLQLVMSIVSTIRG